MYGYNIHKNWPLIPPIGIFIEHAEQIAIITDITYIAGLSIQTKTNMFGL